MLDLPVQLVFWGLTPCSMWLPRDHESGDLPPQGPGVLPGQWYCLPRATGLKWGHVPKQGQSDLLPGFSYHLRKLLEPRALSAVTAELLKCAQGWHQGTSESANVPHPRPGASWPSYSWPPFLSTGRQPVWRRTGKRCTDTESHTPVVCPELLDPATPAA